MFRIAKPESLVLLSPSKDDVRSTYLPHDRNHVPILCFGLGWKAKRRGVPAVGHGAEVRFLQQSVARPGFSILIPVNHDRLQLLLFDMPGQSGGL